MLVATVLERVKRQFGDEYDILINDADIFGWIYEAETDIIRNTGCNNQVVSTTVAAFPVTIPEVVNIKRITVDGRAMKYTTKEELDLVGLNPDVTGSTDLPSYWYKEGTKAYLWPDNALDTTAVKIEYNKMPVLISALPGAFTVPEVHHTDVMRYCIARAHNKNQDLQAEQVEMNAYERNIGKRNEEINEIDHSQYKGNDPLDFNPYDTW